MNKHNDYIWNWAQQHVNKDTLRHKVTWRWQSPGWVKSPSLEKFTSDFNKQIVQHLFRKWRCFKWHKEKVTSHHIAAKETPKPSKTTKGKQFCPFFKREKQLRCVHDTGCSSQLCNQLSPPQVTFVPCPLLKQFNLPNLVFPEGNWGNNTAAS